jgi:hypothetical protein
MTCHQCGIEFQPARRGRPPQYCSVKCREHARPKTEQRRQQTRSSYRRHYQRNREKILAKGQEWAKSHPDKCREYTAAYRQQHPEAREKHRLNAQEYVQKNREKVSAQKRAYRLANIDKEQKYRNDHRENENRRSREWEAKYRQQNREEYRRKQREAYKKNPEKYLAKNHRYEARKIGGGGAYTTDEWKALLKSSGYRCVWCGCSDVKLTVDHVIPVSMGGTSNIDNIQPLCLSCNSRKRDKTMDFRGSICR